jgi:TonB family protein
MRTCVVFCLLLAVAFATRAGEPSNAVSPSDGILQLRHYSAPVYPAEALKQHLGGLVIVLCMVDVNGIVHDAHVLRSTAHGMFDASALQAVKSWVYEPTFVNGKPVDARVQAMIRFDNGAALAASIEASHVLPPQVITHTSATFDTRVDHLEDHLASEP